jgi:hypothetical protein
VSKILDRLDDTGEYRDLLMLGEAANCDLLTLLKRLSALANVVTTSADEKNLAHENFLVSVALSLVIINPLTSSEPRVIFVRS